MVDSFREDLTVAWEEFHSFHSTQGTQDSRRRTRSKNNEEWSVPEEEPVTRRRRAELGAWDLGSLDWCFPVPSGNLTVCYWKWWFIVDFPIKNGDFP